MYQCANVPETEDAKILLEPFAIACIGGIPKKIKALEEKLVEKENAKRKAVSRQLYEVAAKERDACLTLKERIKQDIFIWKEQMAVNQLEITEDDVLKVVSKSTGVPIEKISDKENKNLLENQLYKPFGLNFLTSFCFIVSIFPLNSLK